MHVFCDSLVLLLCIPCITSPPEETQDRGNIRSSSPKGQAMALVSKLTITPLTVVFNP